MLLQKDNVNRNAIISLILSALSFSLMTVCVKKLNNSIPVAEIVLIRSIASLLVTRYLLRKANISPWGKNKSLLCIRGVLGTLALFCIFYTLQNIPLSAATIIQYTYPSFTTITGIIFLKEYLKKGSIFGILIGWLGVIFVAQPKYLLPTGENLPFEYVFIGLIGAALTALAYTTVRKLTENENSLVIVFYFPLISIPLSIPFFINEMILPTGENIFWLLGICFFTQLGQLGITFGLKKIPTAKASSVNYIQVVFASILGIMFFSESFNLFSLIGAILVFISTLFTFIY